MIVTISVSEIAQPAVFIRVCARLIPNIRDAESDILKHASAAFLRASDSGHMDPKPQRESQDRAFPRARSPVLRYGVALLLTGFAAGFDFCFPSVGSLWPVVPFYVTTGVVAWFGGLRAGLLATAVAAFLLDYYFIRPGGLALDRIGLTRLVVGILAMSTISWLFDNRARARELAQATREGSDDLSRRHEAMLSSAARLAGMGSWEYDIVKDHLVWDDETIRISGMTRETFGETSAAFFALVHPDDRRALRAMQIKNLAGPGTFELEYRIIRPDGALRVLYDRGEVTLWENGKPVHATGMVMDITERRQAEEALRSSEERWRSVFDNSAVGIALAGTPGVFMATNRAFQEMVGYTDEELRSMTSMDITLEEDRPAHMALTAELWAGKLQRFQLEKRYRRKDGKLIWVRVTISPLPGTGAAPRLAVGIVEDITGHRSLEEQLRQSQKLEAVGRLAGGVAHDFNNMLGVILGHCARLERELSLEQRQESVEQIRQAATRSANLTRQLLAFSSKQILLPRILDLNATLGELTTMLGRLLGDDVELVVRLGPELGLVKADPGQIEQVVINLAVNARDAMPRGGQLVIATSNVELHSSQADHPPVVAGPYVMLSMSDTGGGIAPEVINNIFEPFFTTKEQGKGTGLGLSTVYGIANQSGGHIRVQSEPGKGTTFRIYLPQAESQSEVALDKVSLSSDGGGKETILLAEDEPRLCEIIRLMLEGAGYTVLEAHNGHEAIEVARKHSGDIDLLLTDVVMPAGMNGLELAVSIGTLRPGIKTLYMTGYAGDVVGERGMAVLQTSLLQKPFNAGSLRRKVREVLSA